MRIENEKQFSTASSTKPFIKKQLMKWGVRQTMLKGNAWIVLGKIWTCWSHLMTHFRLCCTTDTGSCPFFKTSGPSKYELERQIQDSMTKERASLRKTKSSLFTRHWISLFKDPSWNISVELVRDIPHCMSKSWSHKLFQPFNRAKQQSSRFVTTLPHPCKMNKLISK